MNYGILVAEFLKGDYPDFSNALIVILAAGAIWAFANNFIKSRPGRRLLNIFLALVLAGVAFFMILTVMKGRLF